MLQLRIFSCFHILELAEVEIDGRDSYWYKLLFVLALDRNTCVKMSSEEKQLVLRNTGC